VAPDGWHHRDAGRATVGFEAYSVMSFIFIFVSVGLWRCDFGYCPSTVAFAASGQSHSAVAANGARSQAISRDGVLSIQMADAAARRPPVESVLGHFTKKRKLQRIEPEPDGGAMVRYRVRLRRSTRPDALVHEAVTRGGPAVAAAAFDSLPASAER